MIFVKGGPRRLEIPHHVPHSCLRLASLSNLHTSAGVCGCVVWQGVLSVWIDDVLGCSFGKYDILLCNRTWSMAAHGGLVVCQCSRLDTSGLTLVGFLKIANVVKFENEKYSVMCKKKLK